MILKNGLVFYDNNGFVNKDIFISNSVISDKSDDTDFIDCKGFYVIPGLIDIHTHGAVGYDHLDADSQGENAICEYMLSHGITSYLATIMTESHDKISYALENIKYYRSEKHNGSKIAGVYLEGPYFSQEFRGAQNSKYIRKPSYQEFIEFVNDSGNCIKAVSIAPEIDGAQDFIKKASQFISVSIGHTASDYDTAMKAVKNGASIFTHTYNGMRGFHHRNPGTVGAAFDSDAYCEFICDGIHVHPAAIRALYKIKGCEKMIMISDSIRPAGNRDGRYSSGGQNVTVKEGKAYLDSGVLAGSTTNLLDEIRNAISFGIPFEDAVKMATANPAKAVKIFDTVGSITKGKKADILILDKDLNIKHIICDGKINR